MWLTLLDKIGWGKGRGDGDAVTTTTPAKGTGTPSMIGSILFVDDENGRGFYKRYPSDVSGSLYLTYVDDLYRFSYKRLSPPEPYFVNSTWVRSDLVELPRLLPSWVAAPYLYYTICPGWWSFSISKCPLFARPKIE
jgi:hypothetical protein